MRRLSLLILCVSVILVMINYAPVYAQPSSEVALKRMLDREAHRSVHHLFGADFKDTQSRLYYQADIKAFIAKENIVLDKYPPEVQKALSQPNVVGLYVPNIVPVKAPVAIPPKTQAGTAPKMLSTGTGVRGPSIFVPIDGGPIGGYWVGRGFECPDGRSSCKSCESCYGYDPYNHYSSCVCVQSCRNCYECTLCIGHRPDPSPNPSRPQQ